MILMPVHKMDLEEVKNLPKTCLPILVNDPYQAYALTTFLISPKNISNGIIADKAFLNKKLILGKNIQIDNFTNIKENTQILEVDLLISPNNKSFWSQFSLKCFYFLCTFRKNCQN